MTSGCDQCGVTAEDDCTMDCPSRRQRHAPGLALFDAQQAAGRAREATKARDAAIVAARADGESVSVIAAAVGMTGPGVRRVLARMGDT